MALPCLLHLSSDDIIDEAGGKSQAKKVLCSRFRILKFYILLSILVSIYDILITYFPKSNISSY